MVAGVETARKLLSAYRLALIGKGSAAQHDPSAKLRINPELAKKTMVASGSLPLTVLLRHRLRWIAEGGVIGSRNFVHDWLNSSQPAPKKGKLTSLKALNFEKHGLCWSRRLRGGP